jgi:tRNA nucleotidyltransferase (CCA-adding enzyme)
MKLRQLLSTMQTVQEKIGASPCYLIGGVSRDKYLGHLENISDIDITNGDRSIEFLSQEFAHELKKKYKITRKVMADGHSTIFIGNLKIDFSSNFNVPRIENMLQKMGIPHPTPMQKEIFSRDFTCNTLLISLDLKTLIDPTERGFRDISAKKIRTCLSPKTTLTSNRNRVVRAIYLATKLDFDVDEKIIEYVRSNPSVINVSTKKVMKEKLDEAFTRDPDKASYLVGKMGLWDHIPVSAIIHPYYMRRGQNG